MIIDIKVSVILILSLMFFREVFTEQFESITDCSVNTSQLKGKSMKNSIVQSQNLFEIRPCSLNIEVEQCSLQEALGSFDYKNGLSQSFSVALDTIG